MAKYFLEIEWEVDRCPTVSIGCSLDVVSPLHARERELGTSAELRSVIELTWLTLDAELSALLVCQEYTDSNSQFDAQLHPEVSPTPFLLQEVRSEEIYEGTIPISILSYRFDLIKSRASTYVRAFTYLRGRSSDCLRTLEPTWLMASSFNSDFFLTGYQLFTVQKK